MADKRRGRGLPVFGILLVLLGALLLLQTVGVVSWGLWLELWRFWPVALIAGGVSIILGRRFPVLASLVVVFLLVGTVGAAAFFIVADTESFVVSEFSESLDGAEFLELEVEFGAGELRISDLPLGSTDLLQARLSGSGSSAALLSKVVRSENRAEVKLGNVQNSFFNLAIDRKLEVKIARDVEVNLSIESGAGDINVDLEQLQVAELLMAAGAVSATLVTPAVADFTIASVDVGASSLEITVPEGVAARIDVDAGLASVDIADRFPKVNGIHESPDYDTATRRLALDIDGGAASIEVE